jgi:hypothetical protein
MKVKAVQRLVITVAAVLVGFYSSFAQSNQSSEPPSSEMSAKPLLLGVRHSEPGGARAMRSEGLLQLAYADHVVNIGQTAV